MTVIRCALALTFAFSLFTSASKAIASEERPLDSLLQQGPGPYIVVPVFASCRTVCSTESRALAAAWNQLDTRDRVPVVLVSFDPADGPADMAHFRELFHLPAVWHLAVLEREEGLRFFASLGFRWRTVADRQFEHEGKVFVLTSTLKIAAVLGPDQLTPGRLAAEIEAARSGPSLVRRIGTHWVGFFGVSSLVILVIVLVAWDKLRSEQRR